MAKTDASRERGSEATSMSAKEETSSGNDHIV